jgi:hypothetical protein
LGKLLPFLEQISVSGDLVGSAQEKIAKAQNPALAGFQKFVMNANKIACQNRSLELISEMRENDYFDLK